MQFLKFLNEKVNKTNIVYMKYDEILDKYYSKKKFGNIKYFSTSWMYNDKKDFFVFIDNDTIYGMIEMQQSPYEDNVIWISFVSIDPKYRNKGIATLLIEQGILLCKKRKKDLLLSSYTEMGSKYLQTTITKLQKKYPEVKIIPAS